MSKSKICPYCGSTSISQCNKVGNKVIGLALAKGLSTLLGGIHTNSSAIEETFLEANYQCNDCNRKWEGDGGISDEEYLHMLLLKYVKNSFQEFTSSENLREFLWKADAYIHGIDEREKITGYQFKDKIYIENETLLSKFYFYKSYACLCYVLNIIKHGIYSKERAFYEINSACQSGIEDCLCAQKLASNKEYDYRIYILKKIRKHCLGADVQISDVMQSNGSNEDAIIGDEFWFGLYDNINNYPSYGNEQKYNRKELVSFWLTNDLRLSLWFLNSVQLGSICNRTMIYKSECTLDDFEESNAQFRQNFRIPIDEKIIYHRDNTFFSSSHNQGLVITDKSIYYIKDNDNPQIKRLQWESVSKVTFFNSESDRSICFATKKGNKLILNIELWSKLGGWQVLGERLASSFTELASLLK